MEAAILLSLAKEQGLVTVSFLLESVLQKPEESGGWMPPKSDAEDVLASRFWLCPSTRCPHGL